MQFFEDCVCRSSPAEGLAGGVVCRDEVIDFADELLNLGEGAAADCLVGDQRKEALHLVKPSAVGGNEVHVPARSDCEPGLDLRVIVGRVVVDDAVDIQFSGDRLINLAQERHEFLMPVTWLTPGEHRPINHIQCCEQRGGAVPLVVVSNPFDVTEAHEQHWLCALQSLALTLLMDADRKSIVG